MSATPPRSTTPSRPTGTVVPTMNMSPTTFLPASRIAPSYPGNTVGGLDVWKRVFFLKAKTHYCLDLLLPFPLGSSSSSNGASSSSSPLLRGPVEGDANCQTRLASLLYVWTDKTIDWSIFLSCDITSPTLGQDMFKGIIL